MYRPSFSEKYFFCWTLLISLLTLGHTESLEEQDDAVGGRDLETWKTNLHLNDKKLEKLYDEVNNFLIRKDLDNEKTKENNGDTFQVNMPYQSEQSRFTGIENQQGEETHSKQKRSPCQGFEDSLSCFRSYLALWMLQRQGLKDPISLRNIGKRAYSFRNIGKRGYSFRNIGKRGYSFRNIGKRGYSFRNIGKRGRYHYFRNIGKRSSGLLEKMDNVQHPESSQHKSPIQKRDSRFPRSYFRNIGKRMGFRNIGKRDSLFERNSRMSFRNIGKKDSSYFDRNERMPFRNIGKKDEMFGRDLRLAFRNIGKRYPLFERDDRMAFRNIGKRNQENILESERFEGYSTDPMFLREDRMSFRNVGKRDNDDLVNHSSSPLESYDEAKQAINEPFFSDRINQENGVVKDVSDVL